MQANGNTIPTRSPNSRNSYDNRGMTVAVVAASAAAAVVMWSLVLTDNFYRPPPHDIHSFMMDPMVMVAVEWAQVVMVVVVEVIIVFIHIMNALKTLIQNK